MKKLFISSFFLFISVFAFSQQTNEATSTVSPQPNSDIINISKLPDRLGLSPKSVAAATGEYIMMNNTSSFTILPSGMKGNKSPLVNHSGSNTIYGESVMPNVQNEATFNVGFGVSSLSALTTGKYNTAIGFALVQNSKGDYNNAVGDYALSNNTTASKNIALGNSALRNQNYSNSNTIYDLHNIAIGFESLFSNNPTSLVTGDRNIGLGNNTLRNNTIGRLNLAIGTDALLTNTQGNFNVAIGNKALEDNVVGEQNVALGTNSLANTTTSSNVGVGHNTLFSNIAGTGNTALGAGALFLSQGDNNVAIGNNSQLNNGYAGRNISIGESALSEQTFTNSNVKYNTDNVAIGFEALKKNKPTSVGTGTKNIAIGSFAADNNRTGNSNIAIGQNALGANLAGGQNIAIGEGTLGLNTGSSNTAVGIDAATQTTGNENTFLGRATGNANTTGFRNVFIGFGANATVGNLSNSMAIGYNAVVNASDKIVLGNASAITVGGYGAFVNYSDRRLKDNIVYTNKLGLDFILKLKTASYHYKSDPAKRRRDGLIAQDIQAILKDLNVEFSGLVEDNDEQKTLNVAYAEFVLPIINAVQEQQKIINAKSLKISNLEEKLQKMEGLEARLSSIEASLKSEKLGSELKTDK